MHIFSSISSRVIFYVTISAVTLFTVLTFIICYFQGIMIFSMFLAEISSHTRTLATPMAETLTKVRTLVVTSEAEIRTSQNNPREMTQRLGDILTHPYVNACAVILAPDSLHPHPTTKYISLNDSKISSQDTLPQGLTEYSEAVGMKTVMEQKKGRWSNPYTSAGKAVAAYTHPLSNAEGKVIGVVCAELRLDSLQNSVQNNRQTEIFGQTYDIINFTPQTIDFMISRDGHFLISPDSLTTVSDTYRNYSMRMESPELKKVCDNFLKTKTDSRSGEEAKGLIDIFFDEEEFHFLAIGGEIYMPDAQPITDSGWLLVSLYSIRAPLEPVGLSLLCVLFVMFLGLTVFIGIIYFIIRRYTSPLKRLVGATKEIAQGNFDINLPKARHRDEVQQLTDSFDEMRLSLKDYVEKLTTTTAQQERMQQDLAIARHIQMSMLPTDFPKPPEVPEISIAALMKPTREVGGDLYDFFIRHGHLHFIIGDVSGKGVPAAMIMAVTTSMFRARQRRDIGPDRTVSALNNALIERNSAEMFVTLIVGDLNLNTGVLQLCNAGHNPPILIEETESGRSRLQYAELKKNLPIGVFPNYHYKSDSFQLTPGARIIFYTDGVTEAVNGEDELYGEERFEKAVRKYKKKEVEALISSLNNDILYFTGDTPQADDTTLMVLEYHGSQDIFTKEFHFSNDIKEVTVASAMIEEACGQLKVDDMLCASLQLALEEAMVNIISYAHENGRSNIDNLFRLTSDGKSITFTLSDNGTPFDPTNVREPDTTLNAEERQVGGLGIFLVKKIMDSVVYQRKKNHNILTMRKCLTPNP